MMLMILSANELLGVLMASILLSGLGGGFAPFLLRQRQLSKTLHAGHCFSAGVLIAAGFSHLLADSAGDYSGESVIPFIVSSAFFVSIILIKSGIKRIEQSSEASSSTTICFLRRYPKAVPIFLISFSFMTPIGMGIGWAMRGELTPQATSLISAAAAGALIQAGSEELGDESHNVSPTSSLFHIIVLLVSLSFHSVIAGVALAVQQDEEEIFHIFFAVIAHKVFAAFSLGASSLKSRECALKHDGVGEYQILSDADDPLNSTLVSTDEEQWEKMAADGSKVPPFWVDLIATAAGLTFMSLLAFIV